MDEPGDREPSKSLEGLPASIRSLLEFNPNLSESWFESVCSIIKDLQSSKSGCDPLNKMECADCNDSDKSVQLSKIQDELAYLNSQHKELSAERRQTLNEFLDLKGNIRVFCRVRPFLPDEKCGSPTPVLTLGSSKLLLKIADKKSKQYSFDKVFHPQSSQEVIFSEIEPVIKSALDGYNVCIFAYGQTGTGKTYSMEGTPSNPGIVTRGIQALFEQSLESNHTFQVRFSMLEIYMGSLRDLLLPRSTKQNVHKAPCLSVQMNSNGGIEIENLVSVEVGNFKQIKRLYDLGNSSRSTAATKSNSKSSRSHCLTCISITSSAPERKKETNKIWMIDLGGSERLLKTQATGRRLEEGKAINLSLSALGDVISALRQKKCHVPYRNSKLTQVLRDSLGFDSKTLMFVHVSPKEEDLCETICSLGFATRVKSIHLDSEESPEVQLKKEAEMTKLEQKLRELESKQKNVQKEIEKLNKKQKLLLRSNQPSDVHTQHPVPFAEEELHFSGTVDSHKVSESLRSYPRLPRFMKPTICSQRKTSSIHLFNTNTREKSSIQSKMRRSHSVVAESLHSQAMDTACLSEYGSEFSMATGCGDQRHVADDDGECSQGTSEYEIKQVIFSDKEKSPVSSATSPAHGCLRKGSIQVKEFNKKEHSSIEDWVHLQSKEQNIIQTVCGKRVLPMPTDEKNKVPNINHGEILSSSSTRQTNLNDEHSPKSIVINEASAEVEDTQPKQSQGQDQLATKGRIHSEDREELANDNTILNESSGVLTNIPESRENNLSLDSFCEDLSWPQKQKENNDKAFLKCRGSTFVIHPSSQRQINSHQDEEQGPFLETLHALWVSALLGFGIHNLGLHCDFFSSLLL